MAAKAHSLRLFTIIVLSLLAMVSCKKEESIWYESPNAIDESKADVFYLVSVNVLHASDPKGGTAYRATLSEEDKSAMRSEMDFARRMFSDSLNFFSPFYHQYTFESIALPEEEYKPIHEEVAREVCKLFDEYITKYNNGRKFILAGFSQGAEMIPHIIRHMTSEQYSRMAAAYMMGFELSQEDLSHERITAAKGADGFGETVSFNSVINVADKWDFICSNPACCINPVNWATDTTCAEIIYENDKLSIRMDPQANVLTVKCDNPEKYRFKMMETFCTPGNLHHWDLMFYGDYIRENALHRIYLSEHN